MLVVQHHFFIGDGFDRILTVVMRKGCKPTRTHRYLALVHRINHSGTRAI